MLKYLYLNVEKFNDIIKIKKSSTVTNYMYILRKKSEYNLQTEMNVFLNDFFDYNSEIDKYHGMLYINYKICKFKLSLLYTYS